MTKNFLLLFLAILLSTIVISLLVYTRPTNIIAPTGNMEALTEINSKLDKLMPTPVPSPAPTATPKGMKPTQGSTTSSTLKISPSPIAQPSEVPTE